MYLSLRELLPLYKELLVKCAVIQHIICLGTFAEYYQHFQAAHEGGMQTVRFHYFNSGSHVFVPQFLPFTPPQRFLVGNLDLVTTASVS